MVVFGLGGIGLNVVQGARMVGANKIIGVDLNPKRKALAEKFGLTHFVNPKEVGGDLVAHLVALTDGGADYSFECVGNVDLMRQALECCHRGWGVSVIIGVAGAGKEISTRPFQLVTGRVWKGTAFGGARGRTDVPKIVDWYMDGKINIDDLITHKMPLDRHQQGFRSDAFRRIDPQRGGVPMSALTLISEHRCFGGATLDAPWQSTFHRSRQAALHFLRHPEMPAAPPFPVASVPQICGAQRCMPASPAFRPPAPEIQSRWAAAPASPRRKPGLP